MAALGVCRRKIRAKQLYVLKLVQAQAELAFPVVSKMDLPQGITEEAAVLHLSSKVDSNLAHMWQEAGVPIALQYKLGQNFTTVRRFASYEDDRAKVRSALKTDFAPDGAADLLSRAAVAAIVSAWESCQHFAVKEAELKAEAKVLGVTRPVTQTDRMAMKLAFEKTYGSIEDSVEPSDEYLSTKLEELESHEPCASPLSEVTSKKSARTMGIQTSVDSSGHVRIVKSKQKGSLPQGTEELRQVLKVEGNTWCYLAAKFRNREMLRDMPPRVWEEYANYLLGERCFLMKIHGGGLKGNEGAMLRPPWHILLSFEYELRKEAVKKAHHENRPLKETFSEVIKDPELKCSVGARRFLGDRFRGSSRNSWRGHKSLENMHRCLNPSHCTNLAMCKVTTAKPFHSFLGESVSHIVH